MTLLKILKLVFAIIALLSGAILGCSFFNALKDTYTILERLNDDNKVYIFGVFLGSSIFSLLIETLISLRINKPQLAIEINQQGQTIQKATVTRFQKEVKDTKKERSEEFDKSTEESEKYFMEAERLSKAQQYKDAVINYQKSIDNLPTMSAYLNMGNSYDCISENTHAMYAYKAGLEIVEKRNDDGFKSAFKVGMGIVCYNKGDLDNALKYYKEVLVIDKEIGNRMGEALVLGNMGIVYSFKEDHAQSLNYFKESMDISEAIDFNIGKATSLNNIGNFYSKKEDDVIALEYYQKALVIFKEIGNREGEALTLMNVGNAYFFKGDFNLVLEYYQKAIVIFREIGYRRGEALALNNIGNIYRNKGDFNLALKYYKEAETILIGIEAKIQLKIVQNNIKKSNQS
jgi:tetratricopeptide (TPR) repeat protein